VLMFTSYNPLLQTGAFPLELAAGWLARRISFICGHSQNSLIWGHTLKKRFGEFHLRAHSEFFDYLIEQWLENKEIPVVLWSYSNLT
jgi:hypothetical protein